MRPLGVPLRRGLPEHGLGARQRVIHRVLHRPGRHIGVPVRGAAVGGARDGWLLSSVKLPLRAACRARRSGRGMRRRMMVKGQKRSRTQTALLQPCRRKEKQQAARSSRKLQSPVGPGYAVRSAVIALWAYFYTGWAFQQRTGCRLRYIVPLPARPTKDLLATCTISVFVSTEKLREF